MEMSEVIKERRTALGMTQEELGDKLGLQKSAIAKYENGKVENMKRSIILKMAKVLECTPNYLLGFVPEYSPSDLHAIEHSEPQDIELIKAYHSAPEDIKACVRRILSL